MEPLTHDRERLTMSWIKLKHVRRLSFRNWILARIALVNMIWFVFQLSIPSCLYVACPFSVLVCFKLILILTKRTHRNMQQMLFMVLHSLSRVSNTPNLAMEICLVTYLKDLLGNLHMQTIIYKPCEENQLVEGRGITCLSSQFLSSHGFFTIRTFDAFLSHYLTDLKLHRTK